MWLLPSKEGLGLLKDSSLGATRRLINEFGSHALRPPPQNKISEQTRHALEMIADQMVRSPPRIVDSNTMRFSIFSQTQASIVNSKTEA